MLDEKVAMQGGAEVLNTDLLTPSETIIHRFVEAWNRGSLDDVTALMSPTMIHHSRFADYRLDGAKLCYTILRTVFPDLRFEIQDILVKGDVVVNRLVASATHSGELLGTKPTGRHVVWETVNVMRIENDKIVEQWWNILDDPGLMQELGIVSPLIAC